MTLSFAKTWKAKQLAVQIYKLSLRNIAHQWNFLQGSRLNPDKFFDYSSAMLRQLVTAKKEVFTGHCTVVDFFELYARNMWTKLGAMVVSSRLTKVYSPNGTQIREECIFRNEFLVAYVAKLKMYSYVLSQILFSKLFCHVWKYVWRSSILTAGPLLDGHSSYFHADVNHSKILKIQTPGAYQFDRLFVERKQAKNNKMYGTNNGMIDSYMCEFI